jgi:hypothetical protein
LVDELTAIVRVQPQERKGKTLADLLESAKNVALGLILHSYWLCPTAGNVDEVKGLDVITTRCAAIMGN